MTLQPKTILFVGPIGMFLATLLPSLLLLNGEFAWHTAFVLAGLNALFLGLPISTAIAWGSYWTIHKPQANPYRLDRWYRYVERNLAIVAMSALGFVAGVGLTTFAFRMDADNGFRMGVAIVLLVLAAMLSSMVCAILKIALVQRLEYLQKEIKKLEQGDKPATSL
jgi:hypothetical protein